MIQAVNPEATDTIYLIRDSKKTQPFTIGVLDCFLVAAIQDKHTHHAVVNPETGETETKYNISSQNIDRVRFGLKEWSLTDSTGEVKIEKKMHTVPGLGECEGLTDASLKKLGPLAIRELAERIIAFSSLNEAQEKN